MQTGRQIPRTFGDKFVLAARSVGKYPSFNCRQLERACPKSDVNNRWELEDDRLIPRLFYPLPLVETHDLGVPFVMVSHKFEPTSERNGVYARAAGGTEDASATNWALLCDAPALYRRLAALCSSEQWQAPHNLVRVGNLIQFIHEREDVRSRSFKIG